MAFGQGLRYKFRIIKVQRFGLVSHKKVYKNNLPLLWIPQLRHTTVIFYYGKQNFSEEV